MKTVKEIAESFKVETSDDTSITSLKKAGIKNAMVIELIQIAKSKSLDYKQMIKKDIDFEKAVDIFYKLTKKS